MRLFGLINENSFLIVSSVLLAIGGFLLWKYVPIWMRFPVLSVMLILLAGFFYVNKADMPYQENVEVAQQIFERDPPVLVELYSAF